MTHDGSGEGQVLQAWGSASPWDRDIPEDPGEPSMGGHRSPLEHVPTERAASLTRHSYTQSPKQPQTRDPRVLTKSLFCSQESGILVTLCPHISRATPGPDAARVLGAQASPG